MVALFAVCLIGLMCAPLHAEEDLDDEVERIIELSVSAPWQESQSRIDALRWRFDELSDRQRHQLGLVEARNRIIAGAIRGGWRDILSILDEELDTDIRIRAHVLASNAASLLENHKDAFRHINEARELLEAVDDPKARADVFGRVSYLFYRVNEFDKAIEFGREAVEAAYATGEDREVCAELVQLATAQRYHPDVDVSVTRETIESARLACQRAGDPLFLAIAESIVGQLMLESGNAEEAVPQLEYAAERMKVVDYATGISEAHLYLARAYFEAGRPDAAREMARSLPEAFTESSRWRLVAQSHELLADIALKDGDHAAAVAQRARVNKARDKQYTEDKDIKTAYLQVEFEAGLREYELEVMERQQAREHWFRNSALAGSGLLLLLGVAVFRRYRTRVQLNLSVERKNRELASLGEIAHSINARRDAEGVLTALLRGGLRMVPEAVRGEVMVRDWFNRQFRWVGIQGRSEHAPLPKPVGADQAIRYYIEQARELAPGLYLRDGPVLRLSSGVLPGQHFSRQQGIASSGSILILALHSGEELEGFLVLALEEEAESVEALDPDRLLRLRSHAVAALSRWQQLEELARERYRADEALADLRITHADLQSAMRESLQAAENKGRFLAQISHELRTPLHAVNGYSQKLQREMDGRVLPEAERYAGQLHSASGHLLALIDDLMDISRMEAGEAPVSFEPVDLSGLAEEVAGMMRPQMEKTGNQLHMEVPEAPIVVSTDGVKLRQILLNLLSNAARFTDKGHVRLDIAVKGLAKDGGERVLECIVSDDGIGIAIEDQERIFEAFSQANTDVERRSGGTGLGLAVTRNLCELLGGDITIESEPGKGTMFIVSLPLPEDPSVEESSAAAVAVDGKTVGMAPADSRRIFIVEDNRINRELMEEYLRLDGFEVASAGSGEDALRDIPKARPDLILMDMNLPGMQGDEVTRTLKAREETAQVPVIAVSAYTSAEFRQRAIKAGCQEYHTKPVDFPSLVRRIRELLS